LQTKNRSFYGSKPEWDYILDEESTNTAENFTMFRKILEKEPDKYYGHIRRHIGLPL